MKQKAVALALAGLALAAGLCGCGQDDPGSVSISASSSGSDISASASDGWVVNLVHNTLYQVPKGWGIEKPRGGSHYHYPPDGGMLFVMPSSWGIGDMSFEDDAYDGLYYYESRIRENFTEYKGLKTEAIMHGRHYALSIDFLMKVEDAWVRGYALLYADAAEKEIYQYIFVFPLESGGELETNMEAIIESIK